MSGLPPPHRDTSVPLIQPLAASLAADSKEIPISRTGTPLGGFVAGSREHTPVFSTHDVEVSMRLTRLPFFVLTLALLTACPKKGGYLTPAPTPAAVAP